MACGLAAILGYSAGMSDYLKNGVDALVLRNPQDANALVAALQRLLADPSLRATIGGECIATTSLFSWDRHAEQIHGLLRYSVGRP